MVVMRYFSLLLFLLFVFVSFSCGSPASDQGGDEDVDTDDGIWRPDPQEDGDKGGPVYECSTDIDCNPAYRCIDHFCIPRNIPDGDKESDPDDESIIEYDSEWPCGFDCRTLPNVFQAHCDSGHCVIDECWPGYADCNVKLDDGCEQEIFNDMQNCGGCEAVCELKNAQEECIEGNCRVISCEGEYINADRLDDNGCECLDLGYDDFGDQYDSNCDGFDGFIDNMIFVQEGYDGDGNIGNPYGDIQQAIDAAEAGQHVLVAKGAYSGPLHLKEDVDLLGGWGGVGHWIQAFENTVEVTIEAEVAKDASNEMRDVVGVYAENITSQTRMEFLDIMVADNPTPGGSNYGMRIFECSRDFVIRYVNITTGMGGDGTDGVDGIQGDKGMDGQQGQAGCENDSNFFCTTSNCDRPKGGRGGSSPCGGLGGEGGQPGLGDDSDLDLPGDDGHEGGGGTVGGEGGIGVDNLGGDDLKCDCNGCSECVFSNGRTGGLGIKGQIGQHGAGGLAEGEWDGYYWHPIWSEDSGQGECGLGGSGGGGGGGGRCGTTHDCKRYGSAGSGGGGGGEGGTGGSNAQGGGGSFGIVIIDSSPSFDKCNITSNRGGTGGAGGQGGQGAAGGDGGPAPEYDSDQKSGGCGGEGGQGGTGGEGGCGGGGAGGVSFGIYSFGHCVPSYNETTVKSSSGGYPGDGGNLGEGGMSADFGPEEPDGDLDTELELDAEAEESEIETAEGETIEYEAESELEDGDVDLDDELEIEDGDVDIEDELDMEEAVEAEELELDGLEVEADLENEL